MKKIKKLFAVIVTVALICASALSLSASAATIEDAAALLIAKDSSGNVIDMVSTAMVAFGDANLVFAPPISGDQFFYQTLTQNVTSSVLYVGSDENEVLSIFKMTDYISSIVTLEPGSIYDADNVLLMYVDKETVEIEITEIDIETEKDGLLTFSGAPNAVLGGVLIDSEDGAFLGYMVHLEDSIGYAVSSDYISMTIGAGSLSKTTKGSEEPSKANIGKEAEEPEPTREEEPEKTNKVAGQEDAEDSAQQDSGSSSKKNKSKGIPFLLVAVIVGGLVFLVIRKKSDDSGVNVPGEDGAQPVLPAGDSAGRMCIRGEGGEFDGKKFELDGSVTIGRQQGRCNICYSEDAKGISGMHCELRAAGNKIELIDLGSSYGTFVNGTAVNPNTPVMLQAGDRFWLADEKNTFVVYR